MVNYVNTVLVGTGKGTVATVAAATEGQYVVVDNYGADVTSTTAANAEAIKVGLVRKNGMIKWSNIIKKADIKSYTYSPAVADTQEKASIAFPALPAKAKNGTTADLRFVVRITYKDMPTRFRKWSESYEVTGVTSNTALATALAKKINDEAKRARVIATASGANLVLEAMPYDDDNSKYSISPAATVSFAVNAWYTDPTAEYFASANKYEFGTVTIVPAKISTGSGKLVRDAEAGAMGYEGILNRGEGTWPIIKPAMNADINASYDSITLEFENMYRAADDIQRKTKQCLQIFDTVSTGIKAVLDAFVKGEHAHTALGTRDTIDKK